MVQFLFLLNDELNLFHLYPPYFDTKSVFSLFLLVVLIRYVN